MARLLVISSQVVRGAVGLSVIAPALARLGHEVLPLPTVLLSSHPGRHVTAGLAMPVDRLAAMLDALDANGWLAGLDGVLTGYLPSAEHVRFAALAVDRVRRASPAALYLCDPVLGDDPKGLYIDGAAAAAIRDELLTRARLATPNRFELAFLTGRAVAGIDDAARALLCLACGGGVATSVPADGGTIANVAAFDDTIAVTRVARRADAPHGTGDLMSALLLEALVTGAEPGAALAHATAVADAALEASRGGDVLRLPAALATTCSPWPLESWSRRATTTPVDGKLSPQ